MTTEKEDNESLNLLETKWVNFNELNNNLNVPNKKTMRIHTESDCQQGRFF